jgi:1-deoxy-D-xylulose-5-phosphate synthase
MNAGRDDNPQPPSMAERLLDHITSPHQLRRLTEPQLKQLADELRRRIIEVVSQRGGHLASNLGVADLTIALHYVFDFSRDRLVLDVGHQCYPHKLLTGRAGRFDDLRQEGGPSGFPSPAESEYDLFYTGHAGAAISTAAGLAWADLMAKRPTKVVAVVGDASIVNGLAMEGLNNVAMLPRQFLVILNDNSMAIDRTRGGMARMLDRLRTSDTYSDMKQSAGQLLSHLPKGEQVADALRNLRDGIRSSMHGGRLFESLGLGYFGPIDGHDIPGMVNMLRRVAKLDKPAVLHIHTQKGRGAQYALEDPCRFHSPAAYRVEEGKAVFASSEPTWTQVFGETMVELGEKNDKLIAITAAMADGTGLVKFRRKFESRFVDVGISEGHAVAMAAGLAKAGLRPVVAVYSTFMQRAIDQVFQEVCLQNLPVLICMDRAGFVGSDGAVHHGFMDIAAMRSLPGIVLMAPADAAELKAAMELALAGDWPAAIRYPRDEVPAPLEGPCPPFELGKARVLRSGSDGNLLCYGAAVETGLAAADMLQRDGLSVGVVSARFAKPLDVTTIGRLISSGKPMITLEDHSAAGGFGSAVLEMASGRGLDASNIRVMGMPDRFVAHASRQAQLAEAGLDAATVAATLKDLIRHPAARRAAKQ